jgi:hypothetical protein
MGVPVNPYEGVSSPLGPMSLLLTSDMVLPQSVSPVEIDGNPLIFEGVDAVIPNLLQPEWGLEPLTPLHEGPRRLE